MESRAERFKNPPENNIEREIANAYVMGAVDHCVIVDFDEVVEGPVGKQVFLCRM